MRAPSPRRALRVIATLGVVVLLFLCRPSMPVSHPVENSASSGTIELEIRHLDSPEGKVQYLGSMNPRGPWFVYSEPMKKLVERGDGIQSRLLPELNDPRIRNEVVLVLARVGDRHAVPRLIELLPTKEDLTRQEGFTTTCLVFALKELTGLMQGLAYKFNTKYTPEVRVRWQAWHETNKDYLYTPPKPKPTLFATHWQRVAVDIEAKIAGRPTTAFRNDHPWIAYEEIAAWRPDPAYERKLWNFCFTEVVNHHGTWDAIEALGSIRDPRALSALHGLCARLQMIPGRSAS